MDESNDEQSMGTLNDVSQHYNNIDRFMMKLKPKPKPKTEDMRMPTGAGLMINTADFAAEF